MAVIPAEVSASALNVWLMSYVEHALRHQISVIGRLRLHSAAVQEQQRRGLGSLRLSVRQQQHDDFHTWPDLRSCTGDYRAREAPI